MASLKYFNQTTNQWEVIKTDSINGVIPNNQTWTATQGQTVFTISNGQIADAKLLQVYVDGKISTNYAFTNSTTFTFLTGLNSGQQVYAEWFEVSVPATTGHHSTHELNGQDPIDVTKLTNYQEQIVTPISNLQNTKSNHETRITTIENNEPNFVPYTGATKNIDLNGKSLFNGTKELIKPDSSGALSFPNQPMIMNSLNAAWSNMVANTEYTLPYIVNATGNASLIDNSGIFTTPIQGTYFISASLYLNVTSGSVVLNLYKNGTRLYQFSKYGNLSATTVDYVIRGDALLTLNAGDTIKITSINDSSNWNVNPGHSLLSIFKVA